MVHPAEGATSSFIGVGICIAANSLISVALNVQKLAHIRLEHSHHADATPASHSPSDERTHLLAPPADASPHPSPPAHSGPDPSYKFPASPSPDASPQASRSSRRSDHAYLREPRWWLGTLLLNLGELGNFTAYAFAPASLIAPLGVSALVANVFLAPLILKEPFRRQDLWGCLLAVFGGVTVVSGSKSSDKKLSPPELLAAVEQPLFIGYASVCLAAALGLGYLSRGRFGDRHVMCDLGLAALLGAFTVLSTKAVSSFLNLLFVDMFRYWITYPVLVVLVATALLQVNYVNKALQRFDSRVVIPSQFCSFALSCIVGSAVLYREFEGVSSAMMIQFVLGCLISAFGVYVLTRDVADSSSPSAEAHDLPKPATASPTTQHPSHSPARSSLQPHRAPPTLTVDLPGVGPKARKLSVTLGGAQYLLARSPEAGPTAFRGREVGSWQSAAGSVFGRSPSRGRGEVEVVVVEEEGEGGEGEA